MAKRFKQPQSDDISKYILDLLLWLVYESKSPRTESYEAWKCMHDLWIFDSNDLQTPLCI